MIEQVRGTLLEVRDDAVVIEVGGLALALQVPSGVSKTMAQVLVTGTHAPEVSLASFLLVRPENWQLFGFRDTPQRDAFKICLGIPGIGPKLALSILSHLSWQEIQTAVSDQNQALFQGIPGIGKRTAARMIVELSGKIGSGTDVLMPADTAAVDAVDALIALGVSNQESMSLVRAILSEGEDTGDTADLVSEALRRRTTV
jgi:holliday junction DNA helicase RuvA